MTDDTSLVPKAGIPRSARANFARALPSLVALWALGGFYLSLGPALAANLAGSANLLWGGAVIFLLSGTGDAAAVLGRRSAERPAMLYGCLDLVAGVAITLGAVATQNVWALLVGSLIAGVGFGLAFLGAFRSLSALARPDERAGMITAIYIVSYLAFSVPVVAAGVAVANVGLHDVALGYAAVVAGLAALGAATSLPRPAETPARAIPTRPAMDLPPCPGTVPLCINNHAIPLAAATPATPDRPGSGPPVRQTTPATAPPSSDFPPRPGSGPGTDGHGRGDRIVDTRRPGISFARVDA